MKENHIKQEKMRARELRKSRWWQNLIRQNARCYYCEVGLAPEEVTMDHILPVSRGGYSKKGNIVACCKECNTKKQDLTPVEWHEFRLAKLTKVHHIGNHGNY